MCEHDIPIEHVSTVTGILLTTEHLTLWRDEVARIDSEVARLGARRANLIATIDAAQAVIEKLSTLESPDVPRLAPVTSKPSSGISPNIELALEEVDLEHTWVENVLRVLEAIGEGISPSQLKFALTRSALSDRISDSDKGFFHALSRLSDRKQIVKHNGRYYSQAAFRKFQSDLERGLIVDTPPTVVVHSPMATAIAGFLMVNPGSNSTDIINNLMANPEFAATLSPKSTMAYNVIARMKKRNQISSDNANLYLTPSGMRDLLQANDEKSNEFRPLRGGT